MNSLLYPELRDAFVNYFKNKNHEEVASSSLLPENDPSLLFVNAGMVPFKNLFLGLEQKEYKRAVSVQKCVRAGGKHNDLDNVGFTARHHTFFEMLGNFSFGDYFKQEAIEMAWEFLTKELKLPENKLSVTVYDDDDEAEKIWNKIVGLPLSKITRMGKKDNFWQMGDVGPCGPCSEIFWDLGQKVDGEQWVEIWNLVFMQYNMSKNGDLNPLAKPCIDTGMGLERLASVMQGKLSNYETDLFVGLKEVIKEKAQFDNSALHQASLNVVADHLRSISFLLIDGVIPGNEGRGYVLRRIIRRAMNYARNLGYQDAFFAELYKKALVPAMGKAYPELIDRENFVLGILIEEERKFFQVLDKGLHLLKAEMQKLGQGQTISGNIAFKMYDTFGFPIDLTEIVAKEKGLSVDHKSFKNLMEQQKIKARQSWKGSGSQQLDDDVKAWSLKEIFPEFTGYNHSFNDSRIKGLKIINDTEAWVSVDPCPFYAHSGGQVGDRGKLFFPDDKTTSFEVVDTVKPYDKGIALLVNGDVKKLYEGLEVEARVSLSHRNAVKANHTGTHLLHAALKNVLGEHVNQAGSYVGPERLRFDFTHGKSVSKQDIKSIEDWVNKAITENLKMETSLLSYDEAVEKGAVALFGEKYDEQVRVVNIPGFSMELCGGTHVEESSDIKSFKIISEGAVSSGTRRIEAITADKCLDFFKHQAEKLDNLCDLLKVPVDQAEKKIQKLLATQKENENKINQLQKKLVTGSSSSQDFFEFNLNDQAIRLTFLDATLDKNVIREKADQLRQKFSDQAHLIVSGKNVICTINIKNNENGHAGKILKNVFEKISGRGGGAAQTAQGQLEKSYTSMDELKQELV